MASCTLARSSRFGHLPLLIPLALLALAPPAAAQSTISELAVIYGGSWGIAPPAGFTRVEVDLNRNAGGDYIFLCYKKGVGAPITGLMVLTGLHAMPPAGWQRINVDLNRNAGGEYIWVAYTKDPNCTAIKDVTVLIGQDAPTPAGYMKIPVDLNMGASGNYLWLCYRAQ